LIQGPHAAGKTTILYKLKLGEVVQTIPTIGFNIESIDYKGVSYIMRDLGGRDKVHPPCRHYFPNTQAIVFVVDSNDRDRIEDAREELTELLHEVELKDVPLLVLANKQDLSNAMGPEEVVQKLGLCDLHSREWLVQASCATTGDGLYQGLDWLSTQNYRSRQQTRCRL